MFDAKALEQLDGELFHKTVASPLGSITLIANPKGLQALLWPTQRRLCRQGLAALPEKPKHALLTETEKQLDAYFAGRRRCFDLPLYLQGTTFQLEVWSLLQEIPYGQTTTYGALAQELGDPAKSRAVGLANGNNPISIIIPCHRVIGESGELTGYAGGLQSKSYLLQLERGSRPVEQADLFAH